MIWLLIKTFGGFWQGGLPSPSCMCLVYIVFSTHKFQCGDIVIVYYSIDNGMSRICAAVFLSCWEPNSGLARSVLCLGATPSYPKHVGMMKYFQCLAEISLLLQSKGSRYTTLTHLDAMTNSQFLTQIHTMPCSASFHSHFIFLLSSWSCLLDEKERRMDVAEILHPKPSPPGWPK